MLQLTVIEGPEKGKVFETSADSVSLGSGDQSGVRLSDPSVSRQHGGFGRTGDTWTYTDRGSTNGSAIEREGRWIEVDQSGPGVELRPGDLVLVGQSALRFDVAEEPAVAEAAGAQPSHTVIATRTRADLHGARRRQSESLEDLATGYRLEQSISLAFDPEQMLDAILDALLASFSSATHAIILLVDKATLEPKRQIARVVGQPDRIQRDLPISMSVATRVLEEGRSMLFQDVAAEFEDSRSVVAAGLRSSLCAPLWTGEETVGLIQVESRGSKAEFAERDIERLSLFANRAALAIVACELSEAERQNQMVRDLSAMITHDLKGPLTSILASLELLSEAELPETHERYVGFAFGGAKWLSILVAGILDVAKMESSEVKLDVAPLDLAEEIREALALIDYQFAQKNIDLVTDVPSDLPPVSANREFFRRIVVNLAGNAVELSPSDTTVTVSARLSDDGGSALVSVRDEGPGIPEEHQSRIFDKFFQAATRERSHRKVSVGLGLAFCKLAIEAHGGRIWVESKLSEGACFSFSLPLEGGAARGSG
jgi:signal transduction histidine kinase